jgi:hypothetical protein
VRTLDAGEGSIVCVAHFITESASLVVYATQVRKGGREEGREGGPVSSWSLLCMGQG